MLNKIQFIKNLHLSTSTLVIIVVALTYGVFPNKILPLLFDFNVESTDLKNVFRAIMGLYLGMAGYWIIGIIKPQHWRAATLTNIIFMGGLAFGRMLSLLIDGISIPYTKGMLLEFIFMIWGIYNLKMKAKGKITKTSS